MARPMRRGVSAFAAVCVLLQAVFLYPACGGGGGEPSSLIGETHAISQEIAAAQTTGEMVTAIDHLASLTGFDDQGSTGLDPTHVFPDEERTAYAQAQLEIPESQYLPLSTVYENINSRTEVADMKLDLTTEQVVAMINAATPAAYANPDTPTNAILVLMTSRSGQQGSVAPTITGATKLSPVQMVMFVRYLGVIMQTRLSCRGWCKVGYYIAEGLIWGGAGFCAAGSGGWAAFFCGAGAGVVSVAAGDALEACNQYCHDQ